MIARVRGLFGSTPAILPVANDLQAGDDPARRAVRLPTPAGASPPRTRTPGATAFCFRAESDDSDPPWERARSGGSFGCLDASYLRITCNMNVLVRSLRKQCILPSWRTRRQWLLGCFQHAPLRRSINMEATTCARSSKLQSGAMMPVLRGYLSILITLLLIRGRFPRSSSLAHQN